MVVIVITNVELIGKEVGAAGETFHERNQHNYERLQFFKRDQLDGESSAAHLTALRTLVLTCYFGAFQEDLIRP